MTNEQRAYLLPANLDPDDDVCIRVYVPDEEEYIAAFFGALSYLGKWLAWERDNTHKGAIAAARWSQAIERTQEAWECSKGDCGIMDIRQLSASPCTIEKQTDCDGSWEQAVDLRLCIPRMRIHRGVLQQDITGNGDWQDAGDPNDPFDPREDAPAPPPWPSPPVGESGDCLSAANVAAYVNFVASSFASAMVDELTFFQTLGVATTILSALLDIIPLTVLTAAITSVYQLVIDNWEGVRDFDITAKLTELMVCKYNSDGSMSKSQFDELVADVEAWRATLSSNNQRAKWQIALITMQLWGPVGMTIAGQIWGITTYDCEYNECCTWCAVMDFTEGAHGWSGTPGTLDAAGWHSIWGNYSDGYHERVFIEQALPGTTTITKISFTYLMEGYQFLAFIVAKLGDDFTVLITQWRQDVGTPGVYEWTGEVRADLIWFGMENVTKSSSVTIDSVEVCGIGVNVFD